VAGDVVRGEPDHTSATFESGAGPAAGVTAATLGCSGATLRLVLEAVYLSAVLQELGGANK
jgi:hypothetical protein